VLGPIPVDHQDQSSDFQLSSGPPSQPSTSDADVVRRSCLTLTLPASRCASPRKNKLPKQYMLDSQLARLARVSDSGGKNDESSGIVHINTARQDAA
jgi:hypothetical protein